MCVGHINSNIEESKTDLKKKYNIRTKSILSI